MWAPAVFAFAVCGAGACESGRSVPLGGGGGRGSGGDGGGAAAQDSGSSAGQDGGGPSVTDGGVLQTGSLPMGFVKMSVCGGEEIDSGYMEARFQLHLARGAAKRQFDQMLACMDRATTCDAVLRCVNADPSQTCDPQTFMQQCEANGDRLECEEFDNGLNLVERTACRDDTNGNTSCNMSMDGYANCTGNPCTDEGSYRCQGAVRIGCSGGHERRTNCANMGRNCVAEGGRAFCAITGTSCMADRCDGDVRIDCYEGMEGFRVDCDEIVPGLTCVEREERVRCGVPEGQEQCQAGQARCEGSIARVCIGGQWMDFDCSQFLNAGCQTVGDDIRCKSSDWP